MDTTTTRFGLDPIDDTPMVTYEAVSYGERWNGWLTPVVTRETLVAVITGRDPLEEWMRLEFTPDNSAVVWQTTDDVWDDEPTVIAPDADGNYDLGCLGWTFDEADSDVEFP